MRKFIKTGFAFAISAAALFSGHAWSGTVAQKPLFLSINSPANIMFLLDDSGSMQFEAMPDAITFENYMYPRASGVYGADDYTNRVPTFNSNDELNRFMRSSANNAIYYNPQVRYRPWSKPDGTQYDNADTNCAPHNPYNTGVGCRAFTDASGNPVQNKQSATWVRFRSLGTSGVNTRVSSGSQEFWPAVYYTYTGPAEADHYDEERWDPDNYTETIINDTGATYPGGPAREDCKNPNACTFAEEIQNFANWYTYYRSRALLARAGAGFAFAQQRNSAVRIGFATLNKGASSIDGVNTRSIVRGVREFKGDNVDDFFDDLYGVNIPAAGTPLPRALEAVGDYYRRTDDRGPWSNTPGEAGGDSPHSACRGSYAVVMTDGYWDETTLSTVNGNVDGSTGPTISNPSGGSYTYTPGPPFEDNYDETLADVAMYYWNRDLRPDLPNKVPPSPADEAFWQHMTTFTIGLGVSGTLDPETDLQRLIDGSLQWPDASGNNKDERRVDDLWHAAINGRGGYFSAKDPETFAESLTNSLNTILGRVASAASVATNSTRLDTNTLIYQARFDSKDWTGQLLAYDIRPNGQVGDIIWDAASLIPAHGSRDIFTWDDAAGDGVEFLWGNLNATQQAALNVDMTGTVDNLGADRVAFVRGDQSVEGNNGGTFRNRDRVLGDIVNSDPAYVGTDDYGYRILDGDEGSSYSTFRASSAYRNRTKMLYVGANDGMLHAFDAETGVEKFAFVPNEVIPALNQLTDPDYNHRYFVDGAPRAGDAYLNGTWKTVLLGSTGAGGRSVFALDVTNPDSFDETDVMWEFTHEELGYTIGQPTIARVKAGERWVGIFGNGYDSLSLRAQLFIVDLEDGSLIEAIDTEVGDTTTPNGLATPVPVDMDGDRVTDYVYAGDLQGNLWKFDLTGNNSNSWGVAYKQGPAPKPLYQACADVGCTQPRPITVRPTVGRHPDGGVMVYFGTGKYFEDGDNIVNASTEVDAFYGIRDNGSRVSSRNNLVEQTILLEATAAAANTQFDIRAMSNNPVDYASKSGWFIDLVSPVNGIEGERVISQAVLRNGRIIFTSVIPSQDECDFGGRSWLMELDAVTGGRLGYSVFDANGDGIIDDKDFVTLPDGSKVPVSGRGMDGIGKTPGIISAGEVEYKYTSTSDGNIVVTDEAGGGSAYGRQSWRQLQ